MFACSRALKQPLPFRDIIDHYSEFNQYNKESHDEMFHKIPVQDKDPINLIQFYNSVFVPPLKESINHIIRYSSDYQSRDGHESKRNSVNPLLQSPLKEILPRDLNKKNVKKAMKDQNTNLLISYNDSPLLKHEPISFKGAQNLKTRKMIDFEHEEKEFKDEKMK